MKLYDFLKDIEIELADPIKLVYRDFGSDIIPLFCIYTFIQIPFFPRFSFIVFETNEGVYFCKYCWGSEYANDQNEININEPPKYIKKSGIVFDHVDEWLSFIENIDLSVTPSKNPGGIDGVSHGFITYFLRQNIEENWINCGPKERDILVSWHSEVMRYLDLLVK